MKRLSLIKSQLCSNNHCGANCNKYETLVESDSKLSKSIKIITLNQPQNLNALTDRMIGEISCVLSRYNYDPSVKVVIITGTGKSFVSGANIKGFETQTHQSRIKGGDYYLERLTSLYYSFKKPLLAAVNGFCFGGGLELALNCDMIFASEKAILGFPEIKLGLFPGAGGTQKLVKIMGYLKASEYILTGKNIPLQEAREKGLLNEIFKHDELLSKVEEQAFTISKMGMISLLSAKQSMQNSLETGLQHGLKVEKYLFDPLFNTQDKNVGVSAFVGKKKPEFTDN